jgi:hypothetical protein
MTQILQCIDPDQVNDEDYLACITRNTRPGFVSHLDKCAFCQSELKAYQALDNTMRRQFSFILPHQRLMCPNAQKIGEYVLGRILPAIEHIALGEHIRSCPHCSAEMADIKSFVLDDEEQTVAVKPSAKEPVLTTRVGSTDKLEWLRRVVARMIEAVNNPLQAPGYALAGVRGETSDLPLTYQAEEVLVTVSVQALKPHGKERMVLGMVQRDNSPMEATSGATVRLYAGATTLATEIIDELGNFVFDEIVPLSEDNLGLEITLSDKVVLVENLPVH